ncbi:hypothetical protein SELMODRAFT_425282 [Selaginella moellendorffii]|uniref:Bromo domain-containing protein n=1 Tax=Selaginella moellendorffii TaxID=88036 RepID=D8SSL4_SELML|nr:hypothetical protein SELMODRAFT_425282 [Selaginella moellendorffii]
MVLLNADYLDIIKEPMDFKRNSPKSIELFERDVNLIRSNAMKYNTPRTIDHKQFYSCTDETGQRSRTSPEKLLNGQRKGNQSSEQQGSDATPGAGLAYGKKRHRPFHFKVLETISKFRKDSTRSLTSRPDSLRTEPVEQKIPSRAEASQQLFAIEVPSSTSAAPAALVSKQHRNVVQNYRNVEAVAQQQLQKPPARFPPLLQRDHPGSAAAENQAES